MSTPAAVFVASLVASLITSLAAPPAPPDPGDATAASTPLTEPFEPSPIVGGVPTEEGEFDAVVALEIDGLEKCSGTLVDPWVVLTAAHCFDVNREDEAVIVHFGIGPNDTTVAAASYGIHPNYCAPCAQQFGSDYTDRYDFAYVELSERYDPADGILLPLTSQQDWNDTMQIGSTIRLVGYGQTNTRDRSTSYGRSKHHVTTVIQDFSTQGVEFFAGQDEVTRDTCNGDSGGPAIVRARDGQLRLAGVTSRGSDPCGDGGWYSVPFAALPWLDSHTRTELLPVGCETGHCLDLTPPDETAGRCAVGRHPDETAWLWLGLSLVGFRRRRARRRGSALLHGLK